jgi:hypothetical protein
MQPYGDCEDGWAGGSYLLLGRIRQGGARVPRMRARPRRPGSAPRRRGRCGPCCRPGAGWRAPHGRCRRTESARGRVLGVIRRLRAVSKGMMFRYMQKVLGQRTCAYAAAGGGRQGRLRGRNQDDHRLCEGGASLRPTLPPSLQAVWEAVDRDLVTAQSSVEVP